MNPWTYLKGYTSDGTFEKVRNEVFGQVKTSTGKLYGKTYTLPRLCGLVVETTKDMPNAKSLGFSYNKVTKIPAIKCPTILEIWRQVEEDFGMSFNFVLVNFYRGHEDYINWHNDREAFTGDVISISLGCTRVFELKDNEKAWSYPLECGDLFHMHGRRGDTPGCQETHKHRVPKMTRSALKKLLGDSAQSPHTIENYIKIAKDKKINLERINLTFRQL